MTRILRASTLASIAAAFLSFGAPPGAFADGRGDWSDYAWQKIEVADCTATDATLRCPAYREKWDWKRNQWVDLSVEVNLATGVLHLTQRLSNGDPTDSDHVCVTALAVDAAGRDVVAHHQNWKMRPKQVNEETFDYPSPALDTLAAIHIGSKQCRLGPGQDDDLYASVLAGIHS